MIDHNNWNILKKLKSDGEVLQRNYEGLKSQKHHHLIAKTSQNDKKRSLATEQKCTKK